MASEYCGLRRLPSVPVFVVAATGCDELKYTHDLRTDHTNDMNYKNHTCKLKEKPTMKLVETPFSTSDTMNSVTMDTLASSNDGESVNIISEYLQAKAILLHRSLSNVIHAIFVGKY